MISQSRAAALKHGLSFRSSSPKTKICVSQMIGTEFKPGLGCIPNVLLTGYNLNSADDIITHAFITLVGLRKFGILMRKIPMRSVYD